MIPGESHTTVPKIFCGICGAACVLRDTVVYWTQARFCKCQIVFEWEFLELCREQLLFLLQDVLVNRIASRNDVVDIIQEANMPDLAVVQAFDMYWCAWTFVIGHELFHIINREKLSTREEEFKADQFGFQVLIRLIEEQKAGIIPRELDCNLRRILFGSLYADVCFLCNGFVKEGFF